MMFTTVNSSLEMQNNVVQVYEERRVKGSESGRNLLLTGIFEDLEEFGNGIKISTPITKVMKKFERLSITKEWATETSVEGSDEVVWEYSFEKDIKLDRTTFFNKLGEGMRYLTIEEEKKMKNIVDKNWKNASETGISVF